MKIWKPMPPKSDLEFRSIKMLIEFQPFLGFVVLIFSVLWGKSNMADVWVRSEAGDWGQKGLAVDFNTATCQLCGLGHIT
jgi:hypothetical protein